MCEQSLSAHAPIRSPLSGESWDWREGSSFPPRFKPHVSSAHSNYLDVLWSTSVVTSEEPTSNLSPLLNTTSINVMKQVLESWRALRSRFSTRRATCPRHMMAYHNYIDHGFTISVFSLWIKCKGQSELRIPQYWWFRIWPIHPNKHSSYKHNRQYRSLWVYMWRRKP